MHWLGIFFLCLALNFADGILFLDGFYLDHPGLAFWEDPLVFLYGPLLLFFAKGMRQERFTQKDAWHLLPFLLVLVSILFSYHFKSEAYQREILSKVNTLELPTGLLGVLLLIFAHFFIYALRARKLLREHRENLRGYYSNLEVNWALQVINYLLLIFVFSFLATLFEAAGSIELYKSALLLSASLTSLFVFRILLKALNEPLFKVPQQPPATQQNNTDDTAVIQQIEDALQAKIYEDPTLTLNQLAEQIDESPRRVSQVINKHMANNFYDLINRARITEAGRLLREAPEMNITEIMFATGFNSKSSFNTQFRKSFGSAPSIYRKNLSN